MRLVAVSIVKNEADIIEAFVRHTLAWVDLHLIFDHDSTDGTREILQALREEGLPIQVFTDDALGKLQQFRSNHLSRIAARDRGADWIIPLDADEILGGPGRAGLEAELRQSPAGMARSIPLANYLSTKEDDPAETNPVLRLQHCAPGPRLTRKVMVARELALDDSVSAGMGSHVLYREDVALPDLPLPESFYLAHFPLRSPQHQALRVVLAELQKLSQGSAQANVDVHYRLGFQLLAENPPLFFAVTQGAEAGGQKQPTPYQGGTLRYSQGTAGWDRVVRALLPYLEKLAVSHGRLMDGERPSSADTFSPVIRELPRATGTGRLPGSNPFSGFSIIEGLGAEEGPYAVAFLPRFHWGHAPTTRLAIEAAEEGNAIFIADVLTYSSDQAVSMQLNGTEISCFRFPRINQKERWTVMLPLRAGRNELLLRYDRSLVTAHDPRQLAVIFLSLRVIPSS